jgi:hypothetical protein
MTAGGEQVQKVFLLHNRFPAQSGTHKSQVLSFLNSAFAALAFQGLQVA